MHRTWSVASYFRANKSTVVSKLVNDGFLRRSPASCRLVRSVPVFDEPTTTEPSSMAMAVEKLNLGFQQFKNEVYNKSPELFSQLSQGQNPQYLVFSCADSRVCPSITFNLKPGDAFTIRNIANMVPPYDKTKYCGVGAAIEFAVLNLKVPNIVVVGHSLCAGIERLMSLHSNMKTNSEFIEDWVKIGLPARDKVRKEYSYLSFEDQCTQCEKEAVKVSLKNLLSYPFVMEGLEKGSLNVFGAHYDFVNGKFETL